MAVGMAVNDYLPVGADTSLLLCGDFKSRRNCKEMYEANIKAAQRSGVQIFIENECDISALNYNIVATNKRL